MANDESTDGNQSKVTAKKEDVFNILVATDCHLGYEETDPNLGDDSFNTFEEILIKANENEVDFILLGGDLFHHNNPSQKSMNKCMELLQKYTMGNKEIYFELLSNASEVFSGTQTANYLDENVNIAIPVFSIHGNHDDPFGNEQFSCLDTLSSAKLINYFGKWTDFSKVVIKPILLRKGKTKIALYGLSHIKDDRLCRLFLEEKVTLIRPKEDADSWFNILVLHQNRAHRGEKRFISESYLPNFINLVIWGHEHDCDIWPALNTEKGFYVSQPGSSVATSLCEGETKTKHIGILKIWESKMKIKELKLNTVRPFIWDSIDLSEVPVTTENRERKCEEIKNFCVKKVEKMIEKSKELLTGHPKQPKLPLIRLRCEYLDETMMFNRIKFGQIFYKRVANPIGDIIKYKKIVTRKPKEENEKVNDVQRLNENFKHQIEEMESFSVQINRFIQEYFSNENNSKLLVLDCQEMSEAVEAFVDKQDTEATDTVVDKTIKRKARLLAPAMCDTEEQVKNGLERIRLEAETDAAKREKYINEKYERVTGDKLDENNGKAGSGSDTDEYDATADAAAGPNSSSVNVNNKTKTPTASRARASAPIRPDSDIEEVEKDDEEEETGRGKGRGRGRGRGGGPGSRGKRGSRGGRGGRGRAAANDAGSSSARKKPSPKAAPATPARSSARKTNSTASRVVYDSDSDEF